MPASTTAPFQSDTVEIPDTVASEAALQTFLVEVGDETLSAFLQPSRDTGTVSDTCKTAYDATNQTSKSWTAEKRRFEEEDGAGGTIDLCDSSDRQAQ